MWVLSFLHSLCTFRLYSCVVEIFKPYSSPRCADEAKEFPVIKPYRAEGGLPSATAPYSVEGCKKACYGEASFSICGCHGNTYPVAAEENNKQCSTTSMQACLKTLSSQSSYKTCLDSCKVPCTRNSIDTKVVASKSYHTYGKPNGMRPCRVFSCSSSEIHCVFYSVSVFPRAFSPPLLLSTSLH